MKVLLLAPHPFYQERGTPIAVDMLLEALSERGDRVDVITYSEGEEKVYPGVAIHRISLPIKVANIRPGFSWRKVYCDWFLFLKQIRMMRLERYDVVHAVEESSFLAAFTAALFKIPFIYDMDSLLSVQLVDKYPFLKPVQGLLRFFESIPLKRALFFFFMCAALEKRAQSLGAQRTFLLTDVSLLAAKGRQEPADSLRSMLGIEGLILMYVGNLEKYQGISLLLKALQKSEMAANDVHLVIVGGIQSHIDCYQAECESLGIAGNVHFIGRRPSAQLGALLSQADIVASPRVAGENTPMKIYSYLDSGKPLIATRLTTHTQVIEEEMAMLADPDVESFAEGLGRLYGDEELRSLLADRARQAIASHYTLGHYRQNVIKLFSEIEEELETARRK